MERRDAVFLAVYLGGIAVCLILIGAVRGTIPRHLVQVLPIVAAAALTLRCEATAILAAVGVCAFWVVVMGLIWLYLSGVSGIAAGSYTPGEISLTVAIAVLSILGILRGARLGSRSSSTATASMLTLGFVVQAVFMALSLRFLD